MNPKEYDLVNKSYDIQKELDSVIEKDKRNDKDYRIFARAIQHILIMQNSIYIMLNYKGELL